MHFKNSFYAPHDNLKIYYAQFLAYLACALQFLRSKGVAHMDLKPQNLLLSVTANKKYVLKVGGMHTLVYTFIYTVLYIPLSLHNYVPISVWHQTVVTLYIFMCMLLESSWCCRMAMQSTLTRLSWLGRSLFMILCSAFTFSRKAKMSIRSGHFIIAHIS